MENPPAHGVVAWDEKGTEGGSFRSYGAAGSVSFRVGETGVSALPPIMLTDRNPQSASCRTPSSGDTTFLPISH